MLAKADIKIGFIAQEVEALVKKSGYQFDGVNAPQNSTDNYSIAYSQFVMPLVKGMQEQQQQIENLQKDNETLRARLNKLEKIILKN
jgi:trimeric autotransporter adhesin